VGPNRAAATLGFAELCRESRASVLKQSSVMFCPRCRTEYRDGLTECADCQVALVPALEIEVQDCRPASVAVFESNDRFTVSLAKGSLEDAGIPFWMHGDEIAAHLALSPVIFPSCQFLVTKDREAEARELLASLQSSRVEKNNI